MPYIIPTYNTQFYRRRCQRRKVAHKEEFPSSLPIDTKIQNLQTNTTISTDNLPWVSAEYLNSSYVISIRKARYQSFNARMKNWSSHVQRIEGINGMRLHPSTLKHQKKITDVTMKRGRIGCYFSHMKVWKEIIDKESAISFVMEDDVNITYHPNTSKRLHGAFEVLSNHSGEWDIAFLCHYPRGSRFGKQQNLFVKDTNHNIQFFKTSEWHVLYGYAISLSGARKLLQHALPIRMAVDVYIGSMAKKNQIIALQLYPEICRVEYTGSDTESIL